MDRTVWAQRRERVLERLGGGVLVLHAAREVVRNGDSEYPFRQQSDFLYLTGLLEPDSVLVLNPNQEKRFTLFVRPRDKDMETWTGRRAGVEGAVSEFGADQALPVAEFEKELPKLLTGAHTLYFPVSADSRQDEQILKHFAKLQDRPPGGQAVPEKICDLGGLIHELRLIKGPEEIALLRKAAELTRRGHERAMAIARPGLHEYELDAELLYEYRKGGGEGPGYTSIVATGVNSTILHYRAGNTVMQDGELVLIDSGCEYEGYTADVSRTFPVNGRFSREQQLLYELVLQAHTDAVAATKPGNTRDAVHEIATRTLIAGLLKEGLLKGSVDSCWTDKSYRKFYMHGTGHWLGMDVHDVGVYPVGGTARPLAPGFVMTVEPGLYIRPDDDSVPAEFRGIGIRIEDDVLVTASGCELLTADIPRTVDELARAQRG